LKSGARCAAFLLGINHARPVIAAMGNAPDISVITDGDVS
jgi:hypothetical protein